MTPILVGLFCAVCFAAGWLSSKWWHARPSKFDRWREAQYKKYKRDE